MRTEQRTYDDDGELHSFNDQPAIRATYDDGSEACTWYSHGLVHRDNCDLPAVDYPDRREWRFNHGYHRYNDLPSIVHANGLELWRGAFNLLYTSPARSYVAVKNGVRGYLNDKALTINFDDGSVIYLDEDHEFHREEGPAIVWANGTVEYYQDGLRNNQRK